MRFTNEDMLLPSAQQRRNQTGMMPTKRAGIDERIAQVWGDDAVYSHH